MTSDQIKPGDIVVSFDFPFRADCYVEGEVLEVQPDRRIIIRVMRQVFAGAEMYGIAEGSIVAAQEFGWLDGRRMVFLKGTEGDFDASPV